MIDLYQSRGYPANTSVLFAFISDELVGEIAVRKDDDETRWCKELGALGMIAAAAERSYLVCQVNEAIMDSEGIPDRVGSGHLLVTFGDPIRFEILVGDEQRELTPAKGRIPLVLQRGYDAGLQIGETAHKAGASFETVAHLIIREAQ